MRTWRAGFGTQQREWEEEGERQKKESWVTYNIIDLGFIIQ